MSNLVKSVFLAFFLIYFILIVFVIILRYTLVFATRPPVGPNKWYQSFPSFVGEFRSGGANHLGNWSAVSFEGKDPIFIYLDLFSLIVSALLC